MLLRRVVFCSHNWWILDTIDTMICASNNRATGKIWENKITHEIFVHHGQKSISFRTCPTEFGQPHKPFTRNRWMLRTDQVILSTQAWCLVPVLFAPIFVAFASHQLVGFSVKCTFHRESLDLVGMGYASEVLEIFHNSAMIDLGHLDTGGATDGRQLTLFACFGGIFVESIAGGSKYFQIGTRNILAKFWIIFPEIGQSPLISWIIPQRSFPKHCTRIAATEPLRHRACGLWRLSLSLPPFQPPVLKIHPYRSVPPEVANSYRNMPALPARVPGSNWTPLSWWPSKPCSKKPPSPSPGGGNCNSAASCWSSDRIWLRSTRQRASGVMGCAWKMLLGAHGMSCVCRFWRFSSSTFSGLLGP